MCVGGDDWGVRSEGNQMEAVTKPPDEKGAPKDEEHRTIRLVPKGDPDEITVIVRSSVRNDLRTVFVAGISGLVGAISGALAGPLLEALKKIAELLF
jgi:hypothetical protein